MKGEKKKQDEKYFYSLRKSLIMEQLLIHSTQRKKLFKEKIISLLNMYDGRGANRILCLFVKFSQVDNRFEKTA